MKESTRRVFELGRQTLKLVHKHVNTTATTEIYIMIRKGEPEGIRICFGIQINFKVISKPHLIH